MNEWIQRLLNYGMQRGLLTRADEVYCRNRLLSVLQLSVFEAVSLPDKEEKNVQDLLDVMLAYAIAQHLIEDSIESRDRFDTQLMDALMPRPSQVIEQFQAAYQVSPQQATDAYYQLSMDSNYIRRDRIKKDKKWVTATKYGKLDITINLSKPEKDPKDIAKAKSQPAGSYPKCLLCKENEGYAGTLRHPARNTHRIIPLQLQNATYYLQYSPYSYYPEHCIVLNNQHIPMVINAHTFATLLAFVEQFPHYFIGSNADLPIVGGSILAHDHFQGGHYTFAMEQAKQLEVLQSKTYEGVSYGRVYWPLSIIRAKSTCAQQLCAFADEVLRKWREYEDASLGIYAYTDTTPHNTITPIARYNNGVFELDLVLRNNRTSDEYPLGIFHPHPHLHHIKKENIGLIEVMGLAVLPSRLDKELQMIEQCLLDHKALPSELAVHQDWYHHLCKTYVDLDRERLHKAIQDEVGSIFEEVLEDAGVYKQTPEGQTGFLRFLDSLEVLS